MAVEKTLRQPTIAHMHSAMRIGCGFLVVGNHQDSLAQAFVEVLQQLQHRSRVLAVEVARGLIREQNRRVVRDRARNSYPLLLAAGERPEACRSWGRN